MRVCTKKNDEKWITCLMQEDEIFAGSSEDGIDRKVLVAYVRNILRSPDFTVIAPVVGKMIHTFQRRTGVMYEIHTAIRRNCGIPGKERVRLTREACTWMIKNYGVRKIITHVPADNRAAGIYAVACGLERVGVVTKCIRKNGVLLDMTLYQSKDEDIEQVLGGM
jgi:hypothetical protein